MPDFTRNNSPWLRSLCSGWRDLLQSAWYWVTKIEYVLDFFYPVDANPEIFYVESVNTFIYKIVIVVNFVNVRSLS
jgi:hypothetical protein